MAQERLACLQSMVTAPKDGRWIVVVLPDGVERRVHWAGGFQDDYQPYIPPGWYYEGDREFLPLGGTPVGWRA